MRVQNLFLPLVLIAGLGLMPASRVAAQVFTFTNLHSFSATPNPTHTNSDGANSRAVLVLSGNTLYGTAVNGGSVSNGTVFAVNTDGTGFTNLHNFTGHSDGATPQAGLILSGNTLFGTALGGSFTNGTVFAINTDGTGFTNLHTFSLTATNGFHTNTDGINPFAGLILSGNTLYGTAQTSGGFGFGTVFAMNTDGTGFTNVHSFNNASDGAYPNAGLILSGSTLYGTAQQGGSTANGTVFAVNVNGTGFTNLHTFVLASDGGYLNGGLVLSGNTLYGVATLGGSANLGTVFAINTNGTGFTNLHTFTALVIGTNSDGAYPYGTLILAGDFLHGVANQGGSSSLGTVFAIKTDGTRFTTLHHFTALNNSTNSDGVNPRAGLMLSGGTLYGTTEFGGLSGKGTVFSLILPPTPPLNIADTGDHTVLFWSASSATNYVVQSATNLAAPNWVTATDAVQVIAVTVTNTSPARFFRLQPQY